MNGHHVIEDLIFLKKNHLVKDPNFTKGIEVLINLIKNAQHFFLGCGVHPPSWTKYVRVVGRNQNPVMGERICREAQKTFCKRTQAPDSRGTLKRGQYPCPAHPSS